MDAEGCGLMVSDLALICKAGRDQGLTFPEGFKAFGAPDEEYPLAYIFPDSCSAENPARWLENKLWGPEARRKRLLAEAGGTATEAQVRARVEFYGGLCWICREVPYETIDHVIPVSKGGTGWAANLRPACRSCNSRKGAQWPFKGVA